MSDCGDDCGGDDGGYDCGGDDGADAADYGSSTDHASFDNSHHDVHDHQSHDLSSHDSHAHQQDHSSHSQMHCQDPSYSALPTDEETTVATAGAILGTHRHCSASLPTTDYPATHCSTAHNRDECNHDCCHHPHKQNAEHSCVDICEQQNVFDSQTWDNERHLQTGAARGHGGLSASRAPRLRAGGSNGQKYLSTCNICVIIVLIIIILVSSLLLLANLGF